MTEASLAQLLQVSEMSRRLARRRELAGTYGPELAQPCERCGAFAEYLCADAGDEVPAHSERREAARRWQAWHVAKVAKDHYQVVRERLVAADVPGLHVDVLSAGPANATEPLQEVQRFLASDELSLALVGARGIGKSLAVAWAISEGPRRRDKGPDALWIHGSELAALDFYGESRLETINRAGMLAVDDLGAGERGNPARFRDRMETLWCLRFDRGLQTLATANLSTKEFAEQTDERVLDRLRGRGCVYSCNATRSLRSGREGTHAG